MSPSTAVVSKLGDRMIEDWDCSRQKGRSELNAMDGVEVG